MCTESVTGNKTCRSRQRPWTRVRRRGMCSAKLTAAATVALSMSMVAAFQASSLRPWTNVGPLAKRTACASSYVTRHKRDVGLFVVTDPDVLLRERKPDDFELESLYSIRPRDVDGLYDPGELMGSTSFESDDRSEEPVRFRGLSTTPRKRRRVSARSRSSTMPGFSNDSDRQRAFRDGIRLAERRTGKKIVETSEARRKRQKANGEYMYKNSASVPDSMIRFADEIHQEDRISRAEEIDLGEKTQEAIRLQNLYDNLEEKLNRQPTDDEWCAAAGKINMEAIRQTIEEGLEAKNILVSSNLRLVQKVVNTYIRNGLTGKYNAGDMMQEGIMALIRAAEKFEPSRGFKFSTYAMYWVRASVKRSQVYQSRIITVPQRLHENHKRLARVDKELQAVLDRKPTKKELGEAVGMSELQVTRCLTAMKQQCFSLDQEVTNALKPLSGESAGRDTLNELVGSRTEDDCSSMETAFLREDIIETLNRYLTEQEVNILLLRFGLKEGPIDKLGRQLSIADLSDMVGMKPDKVRRIINKSLRQLKAGGIEEWLAFDRALR